MTNPHSDKPDELIPDFVVVDGRTGEARAIFVKLCPDLQSSEIRDADPAVQAERKQRSIEQVLRDLKEWQELRSRLRSIVRSDATRKSAKKRPPRRIRVGREFQPESPAEVNLWGLLEQGAQPELDPVCPDTSPSEAERGNE